MPFQKKKHWKSNGKKPKSLDCDDMEGSTQSIDKIKSKPNDKPKQWMESLDKIESDLLREWNTEMSNCPAGGCTYGQGHDGDHLTDDADLIPGHTGPRDSGFSNADRIDDIANQTNLSNVCTCDGYCNDSSCVCTSGCSKECACFCVDLAGPMLESDKDRI